MRTYNIPVSFNGKKHCNSPVGLLDLQHPIRDLAARTFHHVCNARKQKEVSSPLSVEPRGSSDGSQKWITEDSFPFTEPKNARTRESGRKFQIIIIQFPHLRKLTASSSVKNVTAFPAFPARPVRPTQRRNGGKQREKVRDSYEEKKRKEKLFLL